MTARDRTTELRRVSNRDLDARLASRLAAQACAPSGAAAYVLAFVVAAIAGCGVALITGGAAASSFMMRPGLSQTRGWEGLPGSERPSNGQVEVELSQASLPLAPGAGQTVLPISFGEPVAPEDAVPPRQPRWHHRHVRHHRRISYFVPAPTDDSPPIVAESDSMPMLARCEATP